MKKIGILSVMAMLLLVVGVSAGDLIEDTVTTSITGNNVNFDIITQSNYMADRFTGNVDSLNLVQTYKVHKKTAGYPNWYSFTGIERVATYIGNGELTAGTRYTDNDAWSYADMQLNAFVTSTDGGGFAQIVKASGGLGENLVHGIGHYTKPIAPTMGTPPLMQLWADGVYEISYGATDIRNNDNPIEPFDYDFGFVAKGDTGAQLSVTKAAVVTEHSHNDQFRTSYNFWYDGTLDEQRTNAFGYNSVVFTQIIDPMSRFITATVNVQ